MKKFKPVYRSYEGGGGLSSPGSRFRFNKSKIADQAATPAERELLRKSRLLDNPNLDLETMWREISPQRKAQMKLAITNSIDTKRATTVPVTTPEKWKPDFDKIKPFASNLINAFSRPPKPRAPRMISSVTLPKVSLDNQRNLVERNARTTDLAALRMMDGSSAGAVMAANLGQKVQGLNAVAEQEAQLDANRQTSMAQMNSNIEAANAGSYNTWQDNTVNSVIARQQQQAANLANAVDKSIMIDNENAKMELEKQKLGIMSRQFDEGVFARLLGYVSKQGYKIPGMEELLGKTTPAKGRYGGKLKRAFGGPLEEEPRKPSPSDARKATEFAKEFALRHKLITGENTHTGGAVPQFVDPSGRPYMGAPSRKLPMTLPTYVKRENLQQSGADVWYTDPFTGDDVSVHPGLIRKGMQPQMKMGGGMKRKWKSAY